MGFRRGFDIVLGLIAIAGGLFSREFKPIGWTTWLVWGRDEIVGEMAITPTTDDYTNYRSHRLRTRCSLPRSVIRRAEGECL